MWAEPVYHMYMMSVLDDPIHSTLKTTGGRSQGHQFEEKQIEQDSQDHLEEPIPDHVGYSIQSFESVGLPYEEAMVMSLETASGGIR